MSKDTLPPVWQTDFRANILISVMTKKIYLLKANICVNNSFGKYGKYLPSVIPA